HLKASASGQANEEADNEGPASVVDSNLKGVEARLRAAKRQFTDALIAMPTSATLAAAGGVSIAGAASALAGASVASKALGAVYGSLVAGFGVTTAVQSGYRLKDLKALQEKVNTTLGKDNALRYNLTTLLGHEIKARQNEIAGRSILASGGAATVGLEIAGVVLAGPTLGASLGLTAAGMAMGAATAAAFRPIKSRHRGLNALGGVEMTTGLPATFLQEPGHLNHLSNKINNQGNIATHFQREIIQNATSKEDGGLRQFKYAFRLHRALAKVIPSHDRRTLANKMVSHPDQVADASLQFMLRTTQFERHYLEQHKVPALEKEVQILFDEFNRASAGDDADAKKALIAEVLVVKAKALTIDSARLSALQDLERRLDQSTRFLNKDFLGDPACKKEFEELQVDFIVAHDLVHEALSRNKLKKVQRQLDERDADCPADPVRNALRKHIGARFARVFAQAYPDKVAYERRGAIEIARAMFTADMEKEKAVRTDEEAA
ncbi:MAG TPA: hypothetical protein VFP68_18745, partial [Burkholderiaceae bacterium]|nr:hypothetical protein [Burkholderiaceae bacterium]